MTDMPIPDEPSTSAARPRERRARPAVRPGSASPLGRLTGGWTWRKGAVAGVLLLLVGTACVLGYRRWNTAPAKEATVQTAPATKRTILEQVALPGTVASGRQSKLAFASSSSGTSVTGRVESISVKTGDTVKAGQELARLNTTSLDLAVQSANSAFTVAQLKLQQLLAGATRSDLATAEQSIIGANATLQKAQSDLRTLQGAPAAAEYASATQAVLNAQNALNNAQTTLDNLQVHSSDAAALANAIKAVDAMTAQQHTAQTELDAGLDQLEAANAFSKGVRGAANDLLNAVNAMCRSNATQCNGIARGATDLASLGTGLDAQLPPIPFAISPRVVAFNEATTDPALRSALFRLVQASAELPALTTEANGRVAVSGSSSAPTNEALRSAMSTRDAAAQALTAANAKLDLLMHPADADVQAAQNALKNAQAGLAAATAKRDATVGGPLPVDIAVQEQSVQQAQVNQQKAQDDRQGAVLVAPASGSFATAAVGSSKTVTVSGLTIGGAQAGNYTLTQPTTTASITAKALTVSGITAMDREYDGGTVAALNTGGASLVGVIGGDTVTLGVGAAAGAFATATMGPNKTVTVSGLTIGGAQAGNYTLTQPTTTASITTKALTVSGILVPARQYDGGTVAPVNAASASLVGVVGADAVSLVTGGVIGNFANAALGVNKPVTITGLMLAGSAAGNYTLTQPAATASITPKILTVTGIVAMSKPFDGNTTAPLNLNGATLVGVVASEAVALQTVGAVGTFADAAVGGGKVVTVSGLTITGADAGNYTLVQPTLAGTILGEEPPADPAPPTEPAGPPVQELPGPVAGLEPDRAALPPDATAPVTVTTSVATSTSVGGTTVNASMSITVPPGAIPNATSIVVQSVASVAALVAQAPLPASEGVIIAAISASALDATGATLKGAFDEPVAITVSVPSASVPAGARAADFVIVFWTGNGWQELVTQVAQRNDGSVEVTAALTHFSVYAVKYRAAPPPPQSPPPTGAPGFGAFPPVFSAGLQAFVVFDGGSVDSLEVAARRAGASGVWVQDERGAFHLLVVDGPAFLRDEFARAFPSGLRGPVAVTLTRLPPAQSMVAPAGADRPVSLLTQLVEWLPLGWLRPRGAEH